MADYTLIRDTKTGELIYVPVGEEEAFFAKRGATPQDIVPQQQPPSVFDIFTGGMPQAAGQASPEFPKEAAEAGFRNMLGAGSVALGMAPILGPVAYEFLPKGVEETKEQFWQEHPGLAAATTIGAGLVSGGLAQRGAGILAGKAVPYASKLAEYYKNYPTIASILESGGQTAITTGDPLQGAGAAGGTAALGLPLALAGQGAKQTAQELIPAGAKKLLGVPTTELPTPPQGMEDVVRMLERMGITDPAQIEEIQRTGLANFANLPQDMQENVPFGALTGGKPTQMYINLVSKRAPGSEAITAAAPRGPLEVAPTSEEMIYQTPLQKAVGDILGAKPQDYVQAQQAGVEALRESEKISKEAVKTQDIYKGMFQEKTKTAPLTGAELRKTPALQVTKEVPDYDEVITELSKTPAYSRIADQLGIPKDQWASQDTAKTVLSELGNIIETKTYAGTPLQGLQREGRKLKQSLQARLTKLNEGLPEADIQYARSMEAALNLSQEEAKLYRSAMNKLNSGRADVDLGRDLIDRFPVETFGKLVAQVRRNMGEEGVANIRDAMNASLIRKINQSTGEKAIGSVFRLSTESRKKMAEVYGVDAVNKIAERLETLRALRNVQQRAIGNSKTDELRAMDTILKGVQPKMFDEFVNNFKAAGSTRRLLQRVVADIAKKYVKENEKLNLDEAQISDFLFSKGMNAARKYNVLRDFFAELNKTKEGTEFAKEQMGIALNKLSADLSKSLITGASQYGQAREGEQ